MSDANRVLLFGANGQMGARLTKSLCDAGYDVTGIDRSRCDFLKTTEKEIEVIIRAVEPAFIINAVAFTAVDAAEADEAGAITINATVPGMIAKIARSHMIPFLHFSTDYVFDGQRGAPYREEAVPAPMNVYGSTKRTGEALVLAEFGHVFRIQLVYEAQRKNFFSSVRQMVREKEEIKIVADQIGAPSFSRHVAEAVTKAAPLILNGTIPSGIYHLTAGGSTSRHGFACAIAKAVGSQTRIIPITSEEFPTPASRPKDARLDCSALAAYGIEMPHWREGLKAALEEHAA